MHRAATSNRLAFLLSNFSFVFSDKFLLRPRLSSVVSLARPLACLQRETSLARSVKRAAYLFCATRAPTLCTCACARRELPGEIEFDVRARQHRNRAARLNGSQCAFFFCCEWVCRDCPPLTEGNELPPLMLAPVLPFCLFP